MHQDKLWRRYKQFQDLHINIYLPYEPSSLSVGCFLGQSARRRGLPCLYQSTCLQVCFEPQNKQYICMQLIYAFLIFHLLGYICDPKRGCIAKELCSNKNCNNGYCLRGICEPFCSGDDDCSGTERCDKAAGRCVSECLSSFDCLPGQICGEYQRCRYFYIKKY